MNYIISYKIIYFMVDFIEYKVYYNYRKRDKEMKKVYLEDFTDAGLKVIESIDIETLEKLAHITDYIVVSNESFCFMFSWDDENTLHVLQRDLVESGQKIAQ